MVEPVEGALIGLAIVRELGLLYFKAMELAGLKTQEEKDAHYNETRLEYYQSIKEPVTAPPE
jgi:hypothetical protein